MRTRNFFIALSLFTAAACTTNVVTTTAPGPAAGDSSSCKPQPDAVATALCSGVAGMTLYSCDPGSVAPADDCVNTSSEDSYCCPGAARADAGADATADASSTVATNPEGVPYPTDHIGWNARVGATPGDRIANVTMQGIRAGKSEVATIPLADFYDPQRMHHDAVVVVLCSSWVKFCPQIWSQLADIGKSRRIVTINAIAEGSSPDKAATQTDLRSVAGEYPSLNHWLEAQASDLREGFTGQDKYALPMVRVIDSRTMEIAHASIGLPQGSELSDAIATVIDSSPAY